MVEEPNRFIDDFYQNLKKQIISMIHELVHYIKKMESFVTQLNFKNLAKEAIEKENIDHSYLKIQGKILK